MCDVQKFFTDSGWGGVARTLGGVGGRLIELYTGSPEE